MSFGLSATAIAGIVTAGSAAYSASQSGKQSGTQTQTSQQQLDPRIQSMLFGDGTDANKGLLAQYQGYLGQQPGVGTQTYGNVAQNFLQGQSGGITNQLQSAASGLLGGQITAPTYNAAQSAGNGGRADILWNSGAKVDAPAQNSIDLTGSYNKFINGDAGANPYLTNALQAGVDATNAGYNKNVSTLTDQLQRSVLPGIRSNAVLAGQYGGSRQGIAEGNAIGDYTKQLNENNAQLAATNSANTIGAQAQSFNQGQDRALAATQGLGAQQYGVASQNAGNQQQANLQNQTIGNNTTQFDSTQRQQNNQFNAGLAQQQIQSNQGAMLNTNALNSNNNLGGIAALSGLLGSQYGVAQNQDNAGINRAGQVNGLLAPYLGANGSTVNSAPLYSNTGANILGGATAGLGLYNGIKNSGLLGNYGSSTSSSFPTAPAGYWGSDIMSAYS